MNSEGEVQAMTTAPFTLPDAIEVPALETRARPGHGRSGLRVATLGALTGVGIAVALIVALASTVSPVLVSTF